MKNLHVQGIDIPQLGLGTFRMKGAECQAAVETALELGYRHIDTGAMYGNEDAVGAALKATNVPRKDLHITTKVWHDQLAPDAIRRALDTSLGKLQLDSVELYMVHWPSPTMDLGAVFDTMLQLRDEGFFKTIGVCNFTHKLIRQAVDELKAPIAAHQFEYHVLLDQSRMLDYLRSKGIAAIAHVPLAQGRLAQQPVLAEIGARHGASAAQVAIAWLLEQPGVGTVPKAGRRESQQANLDAQNVKLDDADRQAIAALPKDQRCVNPPHAPAWD